MRLNLKKIGLLLTFGLSCWSLSVSAAIYDPSYKIRILFVQDPSSSVSKNMDIYNKDRIAHLNNVFRNSYVDLKAEYAGFISLPQRVNSLDDLMQSQAVQEAKQTYSADIVMIWSQSIFAGSTACGRAIVTQENRSSYSAVNPKKSCNKSDAFVHEIGHNLGLTHHKTTTSKFAPYSVGYGNWAWVSMMAYQGTHGGWIRKQVFSNPRIMCDAFYRCGDEKEGDAARWLNENRAKRFSRKNMTTAAIDRMDIRHLNTASGVRIYPVKNQINNGVLIKKDEPDLSQRGFNGPIRSYSITPGWEVRFFTEPNYQGQYFTRSTQFKPDEHVSELNVKSVRVLKMADTPKLYSEEHFVGKETEITTSIPDLNQKVGSFYVPKGWKIRFYTDPNYGGKYYTRNSNGYYQIIDNNMGSVLVMSRPY